MEDGNEKEGSHHDGAEKDIECFKLTDSAVGQFAGKSLEQEVQVGGVVPEQRVAGPLTESGKGPLFCDPERVAIHGDVTETPGTKRNDDRGGYSQSDDPVCREGSGDHDKNS